MIPKCALLIKNSDHYCGGLNSRSVGDWTDVWMLKVQTPKAPVTHTVADERMTKATPPS